MTESTTGKPRDHKTVERRLEHWRDESDAAFLSQRLAAAEPEGKKRAVYRGLADVEERHVRAWRDLLGEYGIEPPERQPSLRARILAWVGLKFGPQKLLALLLREEGHEVKGSVALPR